MASAPGTGHKNIKETQTLSGLEKSLRFSFGVIERLRMKIEDTPSDPQMLLTVRAENCSDISHIVQSCGRTVHRFYGII